MIHSSISVEGSPRRRRWSGALAFLFFATCISAPARAEVPASSRTLARSLFEDARALMGEGKYAEACPKLAESMRLDPAAGTQLNLAVCHEREGRTATAWSEYNDALTQARRDGRPEREQLASDRLKVLSSKLSWLTVTLAPTAELTGLEVLWDGAVVNRAALGVPSAVDPGVHTIGARAPGFATWTDDVKVGEGGGRKTVLIPRLNALPASQETAGSGGAGTEGLATTPDLVPPVDTARRMWAVVIGGAGVSAVIVGSVFGVRAINKWSERNTDCAHGCGADAVAAGGSAQTSAWVADFTIGAGVVGLAAATYLFATSSHRATGRTGGASLRVAPAFFGTGAGFGVTGEFQ